MKWEIEDHDGIDKSFGMGNESIWMKVDYDDDVNHPEVDAVARYIAQIMKNNWNENVFRGYYKEELIKQWNEDEYLQEEYPVVDNYLEERIGYNH